ncbi:MAG: SDR family oxidoreductase, partial [Candidatus Aminicenantes bacterium]|nr:SDR family oxidoreductase [Candidatus Aminicenantes bacterium]
HEEEANAVVEKIKEMGRRAKAYKVDVSEFEAAQNLVKEALEEFGHLDILINNAGMNWDGVIWKMTEEQWDAVINVDLKGTFNFIRAVSPLFKEQQSGKIVNITSINAMRGRFGQSNYTAAKAGTIALTKTVAKELGRFRVNVNAVAPGLIETDMIKTMPEDFIQRSKAETVFDDLGKPEDIAYLVTFLCSEKARHITGEVIKVDGGQYI